MQKYGQYSRFSPLGHLPPRLSNDSETPWLGLRKQKKQKKGPKGAVVMLGGTV